MDAAVVFALIMTLGGLSLLAAALLWLFDIIARRRNRVARRFAGQRGADKTGAASLDAPMQLLISDGRDGPLWRVLRISPGAFAAFRADQPRFLWGSVFGAVFLGALVLVRELALPLFWAVPIIASVFLPGLYLAVRAHERRRRIKIEDHLPEALDIVARCLRIGMPVSASLRVVAQDMSGIIAEEFGMTANQISYGKENVEALLEMAQRTNSSGLRFFSAAVAIQVETGGNLVDVVERLANLARARIQLQRKVRAMTAEAVWSGRFLSAFPILAGALIALFNPKYFANVIDKPFAIPLALLILAFLIANIIFMSRLVRFE